MLSSLVLLTLTAFVIFITATSTLSDEARKSFCETGNEVYVLVLQITAFLTLSASIVVIFINLSKLKDHTVDKQAFKEERCQLGTILIIFDSSYVVRAIFD